MKFCYLFTTCYYEGQLTIILQYEVLGAKIQQIVICCSWDASYEQKAYANKDYFIMI